MLRVLSILGTRPEAIKLAPVIMELGKPGGLEWTQACGRVSVTSTRVRSVVVVGGGWRPDIRGA